MKFYSQKVTSSAVYCVLRADFCSLQTVTQQAKYQSHHLLIYRTSPAWRLHVTIKYVCQIILFNFFCFFSNVLLEEAVKIVIADHLQYFWSTCTKLMITLCINSGKRQVIPSLKCMSIKCKI